MRGRGVFVTVLVAGLCIQFLHKVMHAVVWCLLFRGVTTNISLLSYVKKPPRIERSSAWAFGSLLRMPPPFQALVYFTDSMHLLQSLTFRCKYARGTRREVLHVRAFLKAILLGDTLSLFSLLISTSITLVLGIFCCCCCVLCLR